MAIESKNLLVAVKAFARGNALPLDKDEVWGSLQEAQTYAQSPTAYAGQTVKALVDGKYKTYVLNGSAGAYTLDEVGAISSSDLKQYVKVVTELPEESQEEGVVYINTTDSKGYIWTSSQWKVVFEYVEGLVDRVSAVETGLAQKAPINNPVFTGTVTLAADPTQNLEAATKQYVDRLIDGLVSSAPGSVSVEEDLPQTGYKAGQTWRVTEAGTYAGQECEIGDLIICVADYADSFKDSDFIVVQANIDGAVTGPDASTDANIVVFDGITGKKIKDSTVTIASVQNAVAKAHEHSNKAVLDTFTKNETELLAAAATDAENKVNTAKGELEASIALKANSEDVYTKSDIDGKLQTINSNLNTKVSASDVSSAIEEAKPGIVQDAKDYTDGRIGEIPAETTVKQYIDTAVGAGGADVGEAIETAKTEAINTAKSYTDTAKGEAIQESKTYVDNALTIVEF